jgi:hypothetical protein
MKMENYAQMMKSIIRDNVESKEVDTEDFEDVLE